MLDERMWKKMTGGRPISLSFDTYLKPIKTNGLIELIDKCIINEEKETIVIIWKDGNKIIAKVSEDDKFDKEFGFLLAFYKYLFLEKFKLSKNEYKRTMECIKGTKLKDYLFIQFNNNSFKERERARKYLSNLKVTIPKKTNVVVTKMKAKIESIEVL